MMTPRKDFSRKIALAFLAVAAMASQASAGELSDSQIIEKLQANKPIVTRSLSGTSAVVAPAQPQINAADLAVINRVRGKTTRSLSGADRDQLASIAKQRPAVDLEIYFDYNSAEVTSKALPQLHSLGRALTSNELKGSVMLVGGHTDAKGGDSYNQKLSERRADAVKRFLIENYHISAEDLVAAGYGKKDLKNASDTFAAENRRVQIVNMARQDTASSK